MNVYEKNFFFKDYFLFVVFLYDGILIKNNVLVSFFGFFGFFLNNDIYVLIKMN